MSIPSQRRFVPLAVSTIVLLSVAAVIALGQTRASAADAPRVAAANVDASRTAAEVENVAASFDTVDAALAKTDAEIGEASGSKLANADDGALKLDVDRDLIGPDPRQQGGFSTGQRVTSIDSVGRDSNATTFHFPDGDVSVEFVGRDADRVIRAGNDLLFPEVFDGIDHLQTIGAETVEDFLIARDADAPLRFDWKVSAPEGYDVQLTRGTLLVIDRDHLPVLRMNAPVAEDASGDKAPLDVAWSEERQTVSVSVDPRKEHLEGDVSVDPQWSTNGAGQVYLTYCPSGCLGYDQPNWSFYNPGGYYNAAGNPYLSTAVPGTAAAGTWSYQQWLAPAYTSGNFVNAVMHMSVLGTTGRFGCGWMGAASGLLSPTQQGASLWQRTLWYANQSWILFFMQNISGANQSVSSGNRVQCYMAAGDYIVLGLYETTTPSASAPTITNTPASGWFNGSSTVNYTSGSFFAPAGVNNAYTLVNGAAVQGPFYSCSPNGAAALPCAQSQAAFSSSFTASTGTQGSNTLQSHVNSYAGSAAASTAASFKLDSLAPTNPASSSIYDYTTTTTTDLDWSNSSTQLKARWNLGTSTTDTATESGIASSNVCFSSSSATCANIPGTSTATVTAASGTANTLSSLASPALTTGTTVYTCIKVKDKAGNFATTWSCSDGWTIDLAVPSAPTASNIFDLSLTFTSDRDWTASTALTGSWNAGTDAGGSGIRDYAACFSTSSTTCGTAPIQSPIAPGTRTVSTTGTGMLAGGAYYLCVRAYDVAGNQSALSCSDSFRYDPTAPAASMPAALGRAGEIDWSRWHKSGDTARVFAPAAADTWSGVKLVSSRYGSGAAGPTLPMACASEQIPPPCPITGSGYVDVTFTSFNSNESASNAFQLRATDYVGNVSAWTTGRNYKFDSVAPVSPANWTPVPATSATQVGVGKGTITLGWAAATDATSGVDGYEVRIADTSSLTTVTPEFTDDAEFQAEVAGSTTYFWQVRAVDAAGNAGSWSATFDFATDHDVPVISMFTPVDGSSQRVAGSTTYAADVLDAGAGIGSADIEIRKQNGVDDWSTLGAASYNSGTGKWEYSGDLPSDGSYDVRAHVTDAAAPDANDAWSLPVQVCRDTAVVTDPATVHHQLVGTQAKVWWTLVPGPPPGYIVQRRENGGSWDTIARVPSLVANILDPGPLNPLSTYDWRVQAVGQECTETARAAGGTVSTASTTSAGPTSPGAIARTGYPNYARAIEKQLGGGARAYVNVAGGNLLVTKPLTPNEGRGLDTNLVLAYNSQDASGANVPTSRTAVLGPNWSLGLAGLAPAAGIESFTGVSLEPLRLVGTQISIRDDEGRVHQFNRDPLATYSYKPTAGTFLYVRDITASGEPALSPAVPGARFAASRPDGVTFIYADYSATDPDKSGQLLRIQDRNGNGLTISYECVAVPNDLDSGDDITTSGAADCSSTSFVPSGSSAMLRLAAVKDQATRSATLEYGDDFVAGEGNALGRLERITDHDTANGITEFAYAGRDTVASGAASMLGVVTERSASDSRSTTFAYPAADVTTTPFEDERHRIVSVEDPRGGSTTFRYARSDSSGAPRVVAVRDRQDVAAGTGLETRFDYDLAASKTTVYDEYMQPTAYSWFSGGCSTSLGCVDRITDPTGVDTVFEYSSITARMHAKREAAPREVDQAVVLTGTVSSALGSMPIDTTQPVVVRSAAGGGGSMYVEGVDYYPVKRVDSATTTLIGTSSVTFGLDAAVDHPVVVSRGQIPTSSGVVYAEGRDFEVVSRSPLEIRRTPNSTIPSGASLYVSYMPKAGIARAASGLIGSGATVYVTYTPLKASWMHLWEAQTGLPVAVNEPGVPAATTKYNARLNGYMRDPIEVTSARGNATPGDADDFTTTYAYDGSKRLASVTRPINYGSGDASDLSTTSYAYYANGDLKSETNGVGVVTGYSDYDDNGLAQRVHQRGTSTFNSSNDAVVADGTTPVDTLLEYDVRGNQTCLDDKRENGDDPSIDACEADPDNLVFTTTQYDWLRREVLTTTPWNDDDRRATRTEYDANDNVVESTTGIGYTPPASPGSTGATTSYAFDADDQQVREVLPSNSSVGTTRLRTTTYDAAGRLVAQVEPQGNGTRLAGDYTSRTSYDAAGRLRSELDGEQRLRCHYYDHYGNETSLSEPLAVASGTTTCPTSAPVSYVATKAYDARHLVASETNVQGATTSYDRDEDGGTEAATNELGETTDFINDPSGGVVETIAPAAPVCAVADGGDPDSDPDVSGSDCDTTVDHRARSVSLKDAAGRTVTSISPRQEAEGGGASVFSTTTDFDDYGRAVRVRLPKTTSGETQLYTHTVYDALGRTSETTMSTDEADPSNVPAAQRTVRTYAPGGGETGVDDVPHDYEVDDRSYHANGSVASASIHGQPTSWTTYADGSVAERTTSAGGVEDVAQTYDLNGDLAGMDEDGSSADIQFVRKNKVGEQLRVRGADGRTVVTARDRAGKVVTETTAGRSVNYTYGTSGYDRDLVTGVSLQRVDTGQSLLSATIHYDALGRIAEITRNSTPSLVTYYSYDATGRTSHLNTLRGSDLMQEYSYVRDVEGHVRSVDKKLRTTTGLSSTYGSLFTYDAQGRKVTDDLPGKDRRRFVRDEHGRLSAINDDECSSTTALEEWTYATAHPSQIATRTSYQLGSAPACSTVSSTTADVSYGDDSAGQPRGNVVEVDKPGAASDVSYAYDGFGRLSGAEHGTAEIEVDYDSLNRRSSQQPVGGQATGFGYAGTASHSRVETIQTGAGDAEARIILSVRGTNLGEMRADLTQARYLLVDADRSTVLSADAAGATVATFNYDPSSLVPDGSLLNSGSPAEVAATAYQAAGGRVDPISGTISEGDGDFSTDLMTMIQAPEEPFKVTEVGECDCDDSPLPMAPALVPITMEGPDTTPFTPPGPEDYGDFSDDSSDDEPGSSSAGGGITHRARKRCSASNVNTYQVGEDWRSTFQLKCNKKVKGAWHTSLWFLHGPIGSDLSELRWSGVSGPELTRTFDKGKTYQYSTNYSDDDEITLNTFCRTYDRWITQAEWKEGSSAYVQRPGKYFVADC